MASSTDLDLAPCRAREATHGRAGRRVDSPGDVLPFVESCRQTQARRRTRGGAVAHHLDMYRAWSVTRFAAYAQLRPRCLKGPAGRVVTLLQVRGVAVRAHEVPVLAE